METEFGILGPLEARSGGAELVLGGRNQRAVLAVLLLQANHVVSIERLAEQLYGESTPVSAVTQVHRQVSELRRVVDPSLIETRPPGYLIRVARDCLDLHRFEALLERGVTALRRGQMVAAGDDLRAALALWRGPALADLAYEPFAQGPVARLEELRLAALEHRLEAELALGNHAIAVPELRDLAAEHPLRERLRELLMLALYRSGRQVEALEVYRATREELVETFGVEPGPSLRRLEQSILSHDADLAPPRDGWGRRAPTTVIVAGRDPAWLEQVLPLAQPLAGDRALVAALLVEDEDRLAVATRALDALHPMPIRTAAFVSAEPGDDVLRLARSHDTDLVLLEAPPDAGAFGDDLAAVLERSPADVALAFAPASPAAPGGGVLVPFGGGEHDWTAVELGAWLAVATGERLRVAGPRADPRRGGRDASRLLADASLAVQQLVGVVAEPALVDATAHGLAEAAAGASAVVVGLSARWRQEGVGEARRALVRSPTCPVLVVHRGPRPSGIAPQESATRFTWSIDGS